MSEPSSNPEDDPALLDLAASVSDGSAVDWQAAEAQAGAGRRPVVRALKMIAKIAEVHRSLQRTVILEGGDAARGDEGPPVPGRWGHLELLQKVGEGASADVYRARDSRLEREVALKLLHRSPHRGETGNEAVLREGRLLARVRHPNVATVYGADEHDGRVGVWMEFVRGKTLNRLLAEQGPLGAREASLIGIDLCRALAAVHEKGVVHRDLKAQNVMREEGGRTLLVDFGIGRDLAAEEEGGPSLSGTPLYLAPEVFEGRPATLQSDLYSLGVLLFYLVTGKFPVNGASVAELREAHKEGRGSLLRDLRPDLPGWYVQAVEKALARDPAARFTSAGQMERALGQMSGTWNRVQVREGEPSEPGGWVGRKGSLGRLAWVGALVLSLAIATVWLVVGKPPRTEPVPFERATALAEAQRELETALELYRQNKHEEALAAANRSSELDSTNPRTWSLLTTLHEAAGRLEEEGQAADMALLYSEKLEGPARHRVSGSGYLVRLNYRRAQDEFAKAIRLDATDTISRRQLAMIAGRLGKPATEAELLEGSCQGSDADWVSCGEYCIALAQAQGPAAALQFITSLPPIEAEDRANVDWAEGVSRLALGQLDAAETAFKRMLEADDAYASEAWSFLAQVHLLRGELPEARQALEQGFWIDRRSGQVRSEWLRSLAVAEISFALGDRKSATGQLNRLVAIPDRPKAAIALARRALLEIELGRRDQAEALLQRLDSFQARLDDNVTLAALAQSVRGRLLLAQGRAEDALSNLEDARRNWDEPRTLDSLARAYEKLRRFGDACLLREKLESSKVLLFNEQLTLLWMLNLVELARDHEQLGEHQEAGKRYEQFLFYWGENAADLPLVREAKAELATLTSR